MTKPTDKVKPIEQKDLFSVSAAVLVEAFEQYKGGDVKNALRLTVAAFNYQDADTLMKGLDFYNQNAEVHADTDEEDLADEAEAEEVEKEAEPKIAKANDEEDEEDDDEPADEDDEDDSEESNLDQDVEAAIDEIAEEAETDEDVKPKSKFASRKKKKSSRVRANLKALLEDK